MKRRIAALVLALAVTVSLGSYAFAAEEAEFGACSNWAFDELLAAQQAGVMPPTFKGADMTSDITRAEFAAVAVRVYERISGNTAPLPDVNVFVDTSNAYVMRAHAVGIVEGVGGGKFKPNDCITRQDAATMLVRAYKAARWSGWTIANDANYVAASLDYGNVALFADDSGINDYAYEAIYFLTKLGVIGGVGNNRFAPQENCTREQAIAMGLRFCMSSI